MHYTVRLSKLLMLTMATAVLGACVVTPKKVEQFDSSCMVTKKKIELSTEQLDLLEGVDCITHSCKAELTSVALMSAAITTASTIVSGSIALVGNTLYWAEAQGKCQNIQPEGQQQIPTEIDENYLITEEIINAKS